MWQLLLGNDTADAISMLLHVGLILLGIRCIFGLVSRACERQADLHGAHISSFESMQTALLRVAQLIGQDLDTPNWRHHSIAERVDFLKSHAAHPDILKQQTAHIMRLSTLIIIALLTILTVSIWQNSQRMNLEQARKEDPALNSALEAASNSESDEQLYAWLAARTDLERQHFHKAAVYKAIGDQTEKLSDTEQSRRIYQHRFWFTPFLRISTGIPDYDIGIDNDLAYALVIGPQTEDERNEAQTLIKQIEPRLKEALSKKTNAQFEDTLACIYYVLGDYSSALTYFKNAKQHLVDVRNMEEDQRTAFNLLLDRRIIAAESAIVAATEGKPIPPLPIE
jgi:tetratricopeptide (TPR) repeat protein